VGENFAPTSLQDNASYLLVRADQHIEIVERQSREQACPALDAEAQLKADFSETNG
jgi:hypothetical protein